MHQLAGVHLSEKTRLEAIGNIREAIQLYIEALREKSERIPTRNMKLFMFLELIRFLKTNK